MVVLRVVVMTDTVVLVMCGCAALCVWWRSAVAFGTVAACSHPDSEGFVYHMQLL